MADDIEWEMLDRYFGGQCDAAEVERVARWIEGDAPRADVIASARAVWEATGVVPKRFDVDGAWVAVRRRMAVPGANSAPAAPSSPRVSSPSRFAIPHDRSFQYAAAAILVLIAGGALGLKLAGPRWLAPPAAAPAPAREYATQRGQRADLHLRDGTHVLLGVASRLRVPGTFGQPGRARDVFLEGEAYFEVAHDSSSRFLVHTADAVTEDVGTAFAVRSYAGDAGAQVAVAEGRVVIHPGGSAIDRRGTLVVRGQVGRIQPGGPVAVRDISDLAPYIGWTDGRLIFKDTPLREALPQLGRWFDLEFRLGDSSLASRHVTASLGEQPTSDVLDLLALSLGVRQERRGGVVTLYLQ